MDDFGMNVHDLDLSLSDFGDEEEIKKIDEQGNSQLHDAVAKGDVNRITYLVQRGLNPKIKNKNGQSPRDFVYLSSFNCDVMNLLLAALNNFSVDY